MKKLICTGINNYPETSNDLQVYVNDINNWSNLLSLLKFSIKKLLDLRIIYKAFNTTIKNTIPKLLS